MTSARVSYIPSTILTTSTSALAGSNGAVTFLNKPFAGQPPSLVSTGTFKITLPRSSTAGSGTRLLSINVAYAIEENDVESIDVALSVQSFDPAGVSTPIPTTQSGFIIKPGNYVGVVTIDTPAYANGADPEYYLLDISVTVDTSVVTELRVNDVELVYDSNYGGSLPTDVNIEGYLNVGSAGPPLNATPGYITGSRIRLGTPFSTDAGSVIYVQEFGTTATNLIRMEGLINTTNPSDCRILNGTMTNAGSTGSFGNYLGLSSAVTHDTSVPITNLHGINSQVTTTANFTGGTIAALNGFRYAIVHSGAGLITNMKGISTSMNITGSGTVGSYVGLDMTGSNSAVVTTKAGVKIGGFSGGSNNYGIWMASNTADAGSGICLGLTPDTFMWRGASGQLLTPGDWASRHYLCTSTPTVAAGAGAGFGASASITGTDHGFVVTLITGTTATTSATIFVVTFGAAWTGSAPSVTMSPGNANTAALYGVAGKLPFVSSVSTTGLIGTSSTTALSDSTTYIFRFTAMR